MQLGHQPGVGSCFCYCYRSPNVLPVEVGSSTPGLSRCELGVHLPSIPASAPSGIPSTPVSHRRLLTRSPISKHSDRSRPARRLWSRSWSLRAPQTGNPRARIARRGARMREGSQKAMSNVRGLPRLYRPHAGIRCSLPWQEKRYGPIDSALVRDAVNVINVML
jgi:hypothetical protein